MATGARGGNILPREARICPILATLLVKRMPNGSHHLAITWEIFACWFWLPIHTSISCSIWQRVPKFVLWHLVTWGGSNRRTSIRDNILCFSCFHKREVTGLPGGRSIGGSLPASLWLPHLTVLQVTKTDSSDWWTEQDLSLLAWEPSVSSPTEPACLLQAFFFFFFFVGLTGYTPARRGLFLTKCASDWLGMIRSQGT